MSIDLTLNPTDGIPLRADPAFWMSFTDLPLSDPGYLRPRILDLPSELVPASLRCSHARVRDGSQAGENTFGDITADAYRQPLRWVRAEDLLVLTDDQYFMSKTRNRAAMGYLAALPADCPVVLYWW